MNPTSQLDMNTLRQQLLARLNQPSMGQQPTSPTLGQQAGSPMAQGSPQVGTPPTPQPQFSSPFSGPGAGQGFDEQTKKMAKALMARLLQAF